MKQIDATERYEAARTHAIEISAIVEAKELAQDRAQDLHSIMFDIRKHVPQTIAGVLIVARAVAAYEEAQKNSYGGGERTGGMVSVVSSPTRCFASPTSKRSIERRRLRPPPSGMLKFVYLDRETATELNMIYAVEVEGRGIAAVDNENVIDDESFKNSLRMLRSDGKPLWDGESELFVREASLDEEERWRLSQDESGGGTICLLVEIDADSIPQ